MIGCNVEGVRQLEGLLKELGPRIERKVTRGAMIKAARPIVRAAKANCHRLFGHRSERTLVRQYDTRHTLKEFYGGRLLHRRRKGRVPSYRTRKERIRTRQLERSIGYRLKSYTAQGVVFVAVGPRWPQGAHGHLLEFGHEPSGWYASQRGAHFVPGRPFMREAFDCYKREALTIAIQEHRARVEREAQQASYHARAGLTGRTWQWIHARGR